MKFDTNSTEIDRNRNVRITIMNYVSLKYDKSLIALNAGSDTEEGHFNFCTPLNMLLGFCKDYKCVIINARYKLIKSYSNNNCLRSDKPDA